MSSIVRTFFMSIHTLDDLLARHLRLMLSMEQQSDDALAWLNERTLHPSLSQYLSCYREQAQGRLARLHDCFHLVGREVVPLFCSTTASIIDHARQAMEMPMAPAVRPVLLTATLKHLIRHQVSVSETGCEWAERVGRAETVLLLQQGLAEQKSMDQRLDEVAHAVEQVAPLAA